MGADRGCGSSKFGSAGSGAGGVYTGTEGPQSYTVQVVCTVYRRNRRYTVLWRITTLLLMVCANSVLQHLVRSRGLQLRLRAKEKEERVSSSNKC